MFHVEQVEQFSETLMEGAATLGLTITAGQLSQLVVYFNELIRWNQKINLTAITDVREVAVKHFLDSLACTRALPGHGRGVTLLDVGTGAGFPGLPLKILLPDIQLTLLEPNQKKTAFLRHMTGLLQVKDVAVCPKRVDETAREPGWSGRFAAVITRALRLDAVLPAIRRLLSNDGSLILCRTTPWNRAEGLSGFGLAEELTYDLPYQYGHRLLTILRPLPQMTDE